MSTYNSQPFQGDYYESSIPLDLVMQVGAMKQSQYDRNYQYASQRLSEAIPHDIVKDSDAVVIKEKLNSLVSRMNEFSGSNLADKRVFSSLMGEISAFQADEDVYSRIIENKKASGEYKRLLKAKEENKGYSPNNEAVFMAEFQDWLSNPNKRKFDGRYIPAYDVSKDYNEILDDVSKNPDVIREVEYAVVDGQQVKRSEREVKRVLQEKVEQALMSRLPGPAMTQLMIDYKASTLNYGLADATTELTQKLSSVNSEIKDIESRINNGELSDNQYAEAQRLLDKLSASKQAYEDKIIEVSPTPANPEGNPFAYYTPEKFLKDKISGIAATVAYQQEGPEQYDAMFTEKYKHDLQLDLESKKRQWDIEKEIELKNNGLGKGSSSGKKQLVDSQGMPLAPNELKRHLTEAVLTGESRIDSYEMASLLNVSGKVQEDGSFSAPVGNKDMFVNLAPTLEGLGIEADQRKMQGITQLTKGYREWADKNIIKLKFPDGITLGSKDTLENVLNPKNKYDKERYAKLDRYLAQYDMTLADLFRARSNGQVSDYNVYGITGQIEGVSVKKGFDSYIKSLSGTTSEVSPTLKKTFGFSKDIPGSDLQGSPVKGSTPKTNNVNFVQQFKNQYGFDITNPEDIKAAKEIANNPKMLDAVTELSAMFTKKNLAGNLQLTPMDGNNLIVGSDGQFYAGAYARLTDDKLATIVGRSWTDVGKTEGVIELVEKGILKDTGEKDKDGNIVYQLPIYMKVNEDPRNANLKYLRDTRGDAFARQDLGLYDVDFQESWDKLQTIKPFAGNKEALAEYARTNIRKLTSDENKIKYFENVLQETLKNYDYVDQETKIEKLMDIAELASATDESQVFGTVNNNTPPDVQQKLQKPFTEDEYKSTLQKIKKGISSNEGNYNSENKQSGALGKYQFLPSTLRTEIWDKFYKQSYPKFTQFLTTFKTNPSLQEEVMDKWLIKLGNENSFNPYKVALEHFLGKGRFNQLQRGEIEWNRNPTADLGIINMSPLTYLNNFASQYN